MKTHQSEYYWIGAHPNGMAAELFKEMTAKEKWRHEQHCIRFLKRYGHPVVMAEGAIGTFEGVKFHENP